MMFQFCFDLNGRPKIKNNRNENKIPNNDTMYENKPKQTIRTFVNCSSVFCFFFFFYLVGFSSELSLLSQTECLHRMYVSGTKSQTIHIKYSFSIIKCVLFALIYGIFKCLMTNQTIRHAAHIAIDVDDEQ